MIDKRILTNIYKIFKKNPLKVFVVSDFVEYGHHNNNNHLRLRYLNTLIKLELIEQVDTIYKFGIKLRSCKTVKGYKLKQSLI